VESSLLPVFPFNAVNTTFQLGDDSLNRQYRSILSFNTASLPDTAVIQSAVLKIKPSGSAVGINPFTVLGILYADIRKGYFSTSPALELADFNTAATASKIGSFGKTPISGWYTATLNATGRTDINKTSLTQLRLYICPSSAVMQPLGVSRCWSSRIPCHTAGTIK
jgi:hypothetical protein